MDYDVLSKSLAERTVLAARTRGVDYGRYLGWRCL